MLETALLGMPASLARFTSLDEALAALRDRQVHPTLSGFRQSTPPQNDQLVVLIFNSRQ